MFSLTVRINQHKVIPDSPNVIPEVANTLLLDFKRSPRPVTFSTTSIVRCFDSISGKGENRQIPSVNTDDGSRTPSTPCPSSNTQSLQITDPTKNERAACCLGASHCLKRRPVLFFVCLFPSP